MLLALALAAVASADATPPAPGGAARDSDGDGIPDARDKCPREPETRNGYQDDDGCPDFVCGLREEKLEIHQRVRFAAGAAALPAAARPLLDDIAAVLRANPKLHVRVEGGGPLGEKRAYAVFRYLVARGVAPSRLRVLRSPAVDARTVAFAVE